MNTNTSVVITCPACRRKLRLPNLRKSFEVSCTSCRHRFEFVNERPLAVWLHHHGQKLAAAVYILATLLSVVLVVNSRDHATAMRLIYEDKKFGSKVSHAVDAFLEGASWGLYDGASSTEEKLRSLIHRAQDRHRTVVSTAWVIALVLGGHLFVVWRLSPMGADRRIRSVTYNLVGVSSVLLVVGVVSPMMSMLAFKNIPVIGGTVFKFESKSILGTIFTLGQGGQYLVAALIMVFSIVAPVAKISLSVFAIQSRVESYREHALKIIGAIGKWSMADVFVVAVLLAYFAVGKDETTHAELGIGVYFFVGYCITSLAAGQMAQRVVRAEV